MLEDNKEHTQKLIRELDEQMIILTKKKEPLKEQLERKSEDEGVIRYLNTYYGKELLKKYGLDYYGQWKVACEDNNPELAGPHHNKPLGIVEGTLDKVIAWATKQPEFWAWGYGGPIELHTPEIIIKLF